MQAAAIAELVAVAVLSPRFVVVEAERGDSDRGERLKLARVAHAVVVGVAPEAEGAEHGIAPVDAAVLVASVLLSVEYGESEKAVHILRDRLPREVAEELASAIDLAI